MPAQPLQIRHLCDMSLVAASQSKQPTLVVVQIINVVCSVLCLGLEWVNTRIDSPVRKATEASELSNSAHHQLGT